MREYPSFDLSDNLEFVVGYNRAHNLTICESALLQPHYIHILILGTQGVYGHIPIISECGEFSYASASNLLWIKYFSDVSSIEQRIVRARIPDSHDNRYNLRHIAYRFDQSAICVAAVEAKSLKYLTLLPKLCDEYRV